MGSYRSVHRMINSQTYTRHRLFLGHTDQTFKFAYTDARHDHRSPQSMTIIYMVPVGRCHSTDAISVDYVSPILGVNTSMEFKANEERLVPIESARAIWNMLSSAGWT